jgi:hypothetical protein
MLLPQAANATATAARLTLEIRIAANPILDVPAIGSTTGYRERSACFRERKRDAYALASFGRRSDGGGREPRSVLQLHRDVVHGGSDVVGVFTNRRRGEWRAVPARKEA